MAPGMATRHWMKAKDEVERVCEAQVWIWELEEGS